LGCSSIVDFRVADLAAPHSGADFAKNDKCSTERDEELKVNAFGYGYGIVDIVCVFYLAKIWGFSLLWATGNWKALSGFSFDGRTASMMVVTFGGIRWRPGVEEVVVF
jgi:hypothetical protein